MAQYEIIVKVGPSEHGWDSIKHYYRDGITAARAKRDDERRINPKACVSIRNADTLQKER